MKTAQAHELVGSDKGTEVVVATPLRTYVGWLISAHAARGWVTLRLDDFRAAIVDTIRVRDDHTLHYSPFPPIEVGTVVVRVGYDDPASPIYRKAITGKVDQIARDSEGNRIFRAHFTDLPVSNWWTRRMLLPVDDVILEQLREAVTRDIPARRVD